MTLLCEPVTSLAYFSHSVDSMHPVNIHSMTKSGIWASEALVSSAVSECYCFLRYTAPAPPVLWCAGTYQQGSKIRSAATHVNAKQGLPFLTGFVWSNLRFKLPMPSNIKMSLYEPVDYRSCANWEAEECNVWTEAGKQCFVRPLRWTVLNGVQNEMKQWM
jgi:hypothetical protein